MFRRKTGIPIVICLMFTFLMTTVAYAEEYDVRWLYNGSGGGTSSSTNHEGHSGQNRVEVVEDTIYMVGHEGNRVHLYKSTDDGVTFTKKPVPSLAGSSRNPSLEIDKNGNIYVAYWGPNTAPSYSSVYYSVSTDGGETFGSSIAVDPGPVESEAYKGWSPIIRIDDNTGDIYVLWGGGTYWNLYALYLAVSTDGGVNFDRRRIAYSLDADPYFYRQSFASPNFELGENGDIYLSWRRSGWSDSTTSIAFMKSTDGGNTFDMKVLASSYTQVELPYERLGGVHMQVDAQGEIYVAWHHGVSTLPTESVILLAKSADNGDTFSEGTVVTPNVSSEGTLRFHPAITFDNSGNIYIAWGESGDIYYSGYGGDTYFAKSSDGGTTFSEDTGPLRGIFPRTAVSGDGSLYLLTVDAAYGYWRNMNFFKAAPLVSILAPTSLSAFDTACDNGDSITLDWILSVDDSATGAGNNSVMGYNIYRSASVGGTYEIIGSVTAGTSSYGDTAAVNGTNYNYIVRATDGTDESTDSGEAQASSARNLPLPPVSLNVSDTAYDLGGSITLSWTLSPDDGAGLNNVAGYNLYRYSTTGGTAILIATVGSGTTSHINSGVVDGEPYYYFVKAFDTICGAESTSSGIETGSSTNNLEKLGDSLSGMPGIPTGSVNSLTQKADNALNSYDDGKLTPAVNKLQSLLNEVEALYRSGRIDATTYTELQTYVQNLIALISR